MDKQFVIELLQWLATEAVYDGEYGEYRCAACGELMFRPPVPDYLNLNQHRLDCRIQAILDELMKED